MRLFHETGVLPDYVSGAILTIWPRPIPGPSLIGAVCRSQMRTGSWPEDTGSIYMPPLGSVAPEVAEAVHQKRDSRSEKLHSEEALRAGALMELRDIDCARDNLIATIELGNLATAR
ncbi:MAG: hypothetical protein KBG84_16920, partial [Planctomycetes bacterium]|nr:hypothetical protein [Planctomycetota bacterium]